MVWGHQQMDTINQELVRRQIFLEFLTVLETRSLLVVLN